TEGTYDGLVGNSGATPAQVESFIGVSSGSLNALGNGTVFTGAAIKQTVTVTAGLTLSFDWNFLTTESPQSTFNDFPFVGITPVSPGGTLTTLASTRTPGLVVAPSSTGFNYMTGFRTFSYTFATDGTFTIAVGATNVGDSSGPSGVLVDNFK